MNSTIIPIFICAGLAAVIVALWLKIRKLEANLKVLSGGTETPPQNLVQTVKDFMKSLEQYEHDIETMNKEFEHVRSETSSFFRKIGLVRYQAFKDTGGDQSFSLALLDERNSGVVISSLFGRDYSKIYAKKIDTCASSHTLTEEEQEAINQAITHGNH